MFEELYFLEQGKVFFRFILIVLMDIAERLFIFKMFQPEQFASPSAVRDRQRDSKGTQDGRFGRGQGETRSGKSRRRR